MEHLRERSSYVPKKKVQKRAQQQCWGEANSVSLTPPPNVSPLLSCLIELLIAPRTSNNKNIKKTWSVPSPSEADTPASLSPHLTAARHITLVGVVGRTGVER